MKPRVFLLLSLSLLLLLTGCHNISAKTLSEATPAISAGETPRETSVTLAVYTPVPTATPIPTDTPLPTDTPEPTATPYEKPELVLEGGEELVVDADFTFTDPGYTARGAAGVDLTSQVQVTGEITAYVPGTYTLTYSVTDNRGNTTTAIRTVTVQAVELPPEEEPQEKVIYLTFDDGPSEYTGELLDLLKEYNAKATFFVVGYKEDRQFIARAYEEGHAIGVHTYTHKYKKIYASEEAYFEDFLKTEQVIYEQTGEYTRLFRFPGGSSNTVSKFNKGIMSRIIKHMTNMGYRYFDWNIDSGDAAGITTRSGVAKEVINGIKKKDFALVLQHDTKKYSVKAVEDILKWGTENGYTFLPLSLTSPGVHHGVRN